MTATMQPGSLVLRAAFPRACRAGTPLRRSFNSSTITEAAQGTARSTQQFASDLLKDQPRNGGLKGSPSASKGGDTYQKLRALVRPQQSAAQTNRGSGLSGTLDDLSTSAHESDRRSGSPNARRQGSIGNAMEGGSLEDYHELTMMRRSTKLRPLATPVRLDPFVGRSEAVGQQGLAVALRRLDIKCAVNKVRSQHAEQRFHERPGLKRKRLKSSRWRKRFKEGFVATVGKVQKMREQGW